MEGAGVQIVEGGVQQQQHYQQDISQPERTSPDLCGIPEWPRTPPKTVCPCGLDSGVCGSGSCPQKDEAPQTPWDRFLTFLPARSNGFRPYISLMGVCLVICLLGEISIPEWVNFSLSHRKTLLSVVPSTDNTANSRSFLAATALSAGPKDSIEEATITDFHIKAWVGLWGTKVDVKMKATVHKSFCKDEDLDQCSCGRIRSAAKRGGAELSSQTEDGLKLTEVAPEGLPKCSNIKVLRCQAKENPSVGALRWVTEMESNCDSTILAPWLLCGSPLRATTSSALFHHGASARLMPNRTEATEPVRTPPAAAPTVGEQWGAWDDLEGREDMCANPNKLSQLDNCMQAWMRLARASYILSLLFTLATMATFIAIPFFHSRRVVPLSTWAVVGVALCTLLNGTGLLSASLGLRLGCGSDWDNLTHLRGGPDGEGIVKWGGGFVFACVGLGLSLCWLVWSVSVRKGLAESALMAHKVASNPYLPSTYSPISKQVNFGPGEGEEMFYVDDKSASATLTPAGPYQVQPMTIASKNLMACPPPLSAPPVCNPRFDATALVDEVVVAEEFCMGGAGEGCAQGTGAVGQTEYYGEGVEEEEWEAEAGPSGLTAGGHAEGEGVQYGAQPGFEEAGGEGEHPSSPTSPRRAPRPSLPQHYFTKARDQPVLGAPPRNLSPILTTNLPKPLPAIANALPTLPTHAAANH